MRTLRTKITHKASIKMYFLPEVRNLPVAKKSWRNSSCQTEFPVGDVQFDRPWGELRLGRNTGQLHEKLLPFSKIICNTHCPLNEPFPMVERQNNTKILANDGECMWLFVQGKTYSK